MKKFTIRLISLLSAAVLSLAAVGCGKNVNKESTLFIDISSAGYGIEWLDPLVEMYKVDHPGIDVQINSLTKGDIEYVEKALSGRAETDLFFVETDIYKYLKTPVIASDGKKYDSVFEDITDLYNTVIPGESKTIAEKMESAYLNYNTVDGKNYSLPWMGSLEGLLVNFDVYEDSFGKLPNTTDELVKFCEKIKSLGSGVSPFIFSISDSYWDNIWDIWVNQYNGRENMCKFYDGYVVDGTYAGERYIPEMFLNDGISEALNVLETLLKHDNGFQNELSYTSTFTEMQNLFLESKNKILMCPNGSWIEREMSANYDKSELNIEFMKTPVISALGTKLGITDSELSSIIEYVDGNSDLDGDSASEPSFTSSKGLTKQQVTDSVAEARGMVTAGKYFSSFIPSYGTKKDLAKDFLQLLASDRGLEAVAKVIGSKAPFTYDMLSRAEELNLSDFMVSVQKILSVSSPYFLQPDNLFRFGGVKLINNISSPTKSLAAINSKDFLSADKIYTGNYTYLNSSRWDDYLKLAGIK